MLWAVGIGIISDKFNRVSSLIFALAVASLGYLAMGLIADPLANSIFFFCFLPCLVLGSWQLLLAKTGVIGLHSSLLETRKVLQSVPP